MPVQTIDEVVIRLNEIIKWSIENNSPMGYFAALYKRMTIAVKKGIDAGAFEDNTRMNKLDILFANRYLEAFDAYQNNLKITSCWQKAFDECNRNSITVLQHLLLGINAHINLDLGIAAAQTGTGTEIEALKNDFDTINKVIGTLINEVQDELSIINKTMLLIDHVMNNRDEAVANFSINIARMEAWKFAVTQSRLPTAQQEVLIATTDSDIASLAAKIISPGFFMTLILKLVKLFENRNVGKVIKVLNREVVN